MKEVIRSLQATLCHHNQWSATACGRKIEDVERPRFFGGGEHALAERGQNSCSLSNIKHKRIENNIILNNTSRDLFSFQSCLCPYRHLSHVNLDWIDTFWCIYWPLSRWMLHLVSVRWAENLATSCHSHIRLQDTKICRRRCHGCRFLSFWGGVSTSWRAVATWISFGLQFLAVIALWKPEAI